MYCKLFKWFSSVKEINLIILNQQLSETIPQNHNLGIIQYVHLIYLLFNLLMVILHYQFINITILHQLQDSIVNVDVMHQIQHFLHQIKGEIPRIQMMQLMLQKIKVMQFHVKIK